MKKQAANILTGIRIIFSVALLFFPALSPVFYALYIAAGVSDMIDGFVARKTNSVSDFGSVLDTVADLVFFAACLIKLIPVLEIPLWLYIWAALIALIKLVNIVSGFVVKKKFVVAHTVMNKITGILLFVLPLTVQVIDLRFSAPIVCAASTFAAIQEGHYIRTGKEI